MNYAQAVKLFQLIQSGPELGADAEGNIISASTKLATALDLLGRPAYINRTGTREGAPYYTKDAAAFLREWADALESWEPTP